MHRCRKPISYVITEYGVRFHAKVDYVTLPTASAIKLFGEERISVPVEPVSNGIDLSKFKPGKRSSEIMKQFHLPTDVPIITYLGRTDAEKHLHVLIEAFTRVRNMAKNKPHLLIVGFGTELEHLKNLAYEHRVHSYVTFTGRVTDEEIVELHKVGDVFAMPSPAELQSIATLEAMATGKPVVGVDAGALSELCQDDRNGFLCEQDNVDQIAHSLRQLVDDETLRKQFGKESLVIAKTHDIQHTLDKFESIYDQVLRSKKSSIASAASLAISLSGESSDLPQV